ncbi:MAG: helix-turn-helix protein [Gaiellales bacterium]|jgi:transcriptional regulator with XRE-family HTH domain|nr:helix-turn-helix protein [Gaiellales bacterium]MDX6591030.1 helix-turn-helix protein [Gaiellales bacterium]
MTHLPEGTIGANLRHLVGMHDLLQRELAEYLGLSPQGLWNILNGRSDPRSRTVRNCAAAFGISVEDLFAPIGDCLRAAAKTYELAPVRAVVAARSAEALSEPASR